MSELTVYFDTLTGDLQDLSIQKKDQFSCQLIDSTGKIYKGFILAQSEGGTSYTICDIDFHPNDAGKFQSRPIFRRTNKELQDKKVSGNVFFQRISLQNGDDGYKEFWKMISFLYSFKELVDIGEFTDTFKVVTTEDYIISFKTKEEVDKLSDIGKIIESANLSPVDLENLSKNIVHQQRILSLEIFENLLENKDNYIENYKVKHGLNELGEEIAWHHFLKNNPWILGLNVDIKFIGDFISEGNIGISDTDGKRSPEVDLIGLSDYTILVELKTASKNIFSEKKKNTSRANTWSFSDDFIDGISQCLAQKSEWDKTHKSKSLLQDGNLINQDITRTVDVESIFIIGNKEKEISSVSTKIDDIVKRDVFQRYRLNSKNVKIITFDELYERAKHIIDLTK